MSKLLQSINEQKGDQTNMEILNQIAAVLDKHREVSIQEAVYRILSLPMTKSSVVVKYLSTIHPHYRDGLLKSNLENLNNDEKIFHNSPHQYYENRMLECLDGIEYTEEETKEHYWSDLTLAEFWSMYDIVYGPGSLNKDGKKKHIPLQNGQGFIKRRRERCVLRYYLNYANEEDYKRGLLTLFFPFTNEIMDIHEKNIDELYSDNKESIQKYF
jgi:hypothetical protein